MLSQPIESSSQNNLIQSMTKLQRQQLAKLLKQNKKLSIQNEPEKVGNQFQDFVGSEEMADVIIKIEGESIYAHKLILAMSSPFFQTQFYSSHWSILKQEYVNPVVIKTERENKVQIKSSLNKSVSQAVNIKQKRKKRDQKHDTKLYKMSQEEVIHIEPMKIQDCYFGLKKRVKIQQNSQYHNQQQNLRKQSYYPEDKDSIQSYKNYIKAEQNMRHVFHRGNHQIQKDRLKYVEISDKIKKVTYNTDFFDQNNFERKTGRAFGFNQGKIGKFVESDFQIAVPLTRTKILASQPQNITFVIQASNDREKWFLIATLKIQEQHNYLKWKELTNYRYWRYVVVDNEFSTFNQQESNYFSAIEWFVKQDQLENLNRLYETERFLTQRDISNTQESNFNEPQNIQNIMNQQLPQSQQQTQSDNAESNNSHNQNEEMNDN
eukprot:403357855